MLSVISLLAFMRKPKGAAIAAHCAGVQGKYWEISHALFTNQRELGADLYEKLAASHELEVERFVSCLNDPAHAQIVEADLAYGQSLGVCGTPNFFIGRIEDDKLVKAQRITGAQPFTTFSHALDTLLR